jgi:hypothetical protein
MSRFLPGAILPLGLIVVACGKDAPPPAPAPAPTAAASVASAASDTPAGGVLRLGEPISAPAVALSDVAAHSSEYAGKTFSTSGTVNAVCQEMGCWMEIKDDSGQAHVRMHGHKFFVPKTASGHHARIQATLDAPKPDDEDMREAKEQTGKAPPKLSLDATGVELD